MHTGDKTGVTADKYKNTLKSNSPECFELMLEVLQHFSYHTPFFQYTGQFKIFL